MPELTPDDDSGIDQHAEDLAAIREGIADMEAGRIVTLEGLDTHIRSHLDALRQK